MPVKTDWTNGDVLTANQVSTYLANAGLDFITEVFVGDSSVASIEVNDVFSDQYSNYKVMYQGIDTSSMAVVKFQFLDANGDPIVDDYASSALKLDVGNTTYAVEGYAYMYVSPADGIYRNGQFDVFAPFADDYSWMTGDAFTIPTYRRVAGRYYQVASLTSFRFVGDAGTFQNGSISVYGYRQT